jgi:deazaflavin-dependent oxidoreductase (nitroreductase family)
MVPLRPLVVASAGLLALTVLDWTIEGGSLLGLPYPLWVAVALIGNVALTLYAPRCKRALVAGFQKHLLNPVVRTLLRLDLPLGWNLLETRGRRTGRPHVVPVGNGLVGTQFWIIAEHGAESAYVRNLRCDPRVRIRIRQGGRCAWVSGTATVLDDDDPWARQRWLIGWRHPLRALNACVVRVLGTQLLTVRIDLDCPNATHTLSERETRPAAGEAGVTRAGHDRRTRRVETQDSPC